jgi:DNA-damage-inducible protein J
MAHSATVQLRINSTTKDLSFHVFKKHGLTLTDGIRIYLERVAAAGEIPFSVNIPNATTKESMQNTADGVGVSTFKDKHALFAHMRSLAKDNA